MPPSHSNDQPDLSVEQVETIGRILTPIIRDALRPEFHKIRNDFVEAVASESNKTAVELTKLSNQLVKLSDRVSAVERFHWKIAGGVATLVFILELAREFFHSAK